ncbi:MAG TPA: protease modulator HflK [Kiritimatiellia bacterium]|nr:protease modulator HflK [Kiritimatiellia bacterium]
MNESLQPQDTGSAALGDALRLTFRLLRVALLLVLLAYLASGIFIVAQHERAFVLHFGRIAGVGADRVKDPGLHWTWPRPFSEIVRIPAERLQSLESRRFWFNRSGTFQDESDAMAALRPGQDGYALTGDANLLHHRWAVRFTISDPYRYTFAHAQPDVTLRDELDRAIVRISARFPIDEALRTNLAGFRDAVESELRDRVAALDLGIRLHGVDLLGITPPIPVAPAFDMVTQSAQQREQLISDARAFAVRTANEARAESDRRIAAGSADRQRRVSAVSARADVFNSLLDAWRKHPQVVEYTLRQDVLREGLARVGRKIIAPDTGDGQELRLNFGAPPRWTPEAHE